MSMQLLQHRHTLTNNEQYKTYQHNLSPAVCTETRTHHSTPLEAQHQQAIVSPTAGDSATALHHHP